MTLLKELRFDDCRRLLHSDVVGRVAVATPQGPQVIPLNFCVIGDAVVVATTPYSALGTYGPGNLVAFEIDHVDDDSHSGWSVVVKGRAEVVTDAEEARQIRQVCASRPWAEGSRHLLLRIPCTELSGRSVTPDRKSGPPESSVPTPG